MSLLDHLEKLPHFVGVARAGSIRGYATSHRLSQPAVSKSIHLLEAELEVALLVRSKEGVRLTPAGQALLSFAEDLMVKAAGTENGIRASGGLRLTGRFTLGTYQSIAVYFLPKLLKHLAQVQKALHLDFVTASSAALVQSLLAGSVDFIISIGPPHKHALVHHVLYEDAYSLYGFGSEPAGAPHPRIFTLLTAKDRKGRTLRSYLERAGLLQRAVGCGDFESAKSMVESALGWGLLPERVAEPLVSAGKLHRVASVPDLQSIGAHEVVFSCLRHRQSDQSVRWLKEQIHLMLRSPQ